MTDRSLADELAEIRAAIARLRLRERHLRQRLLMAPDAARNGRAHQATVETVTTRQFDPALLPPAIRNDPAYFRDKVHLAVQTHPIETRATLPRPGWPIRRAAPAPAEIAAALH